MPRTTCIIPDSWKDDPQYNNPSFLRAWVEEEHHERERKGYALELRIYPEEAMHSHQGVLLPRSDGLSHDDSERKLPRLQRRVSPSTFAHDPRSFFWKDCAIYGNQTGPDLTSLSYYDLLDQVYREWFPHRAEDKDVSDGAFFGKFMRFYPPIKTLDFAIRFHLRLCDFLRSLEDQGVWDNHDPRLFRGREPPRGDPYKLRETFSSVFIVIDQGWQENGVILVWKNEDLAVKHGCLEDGEIKRRTSTDTACDLGDASVFHCPLKRAMQLVVSQDPYRAQKRREYNEHLEETLGDPEDECQESGVTIRDWIIIGNNAEESLCPQT